MRGAGVKRELRLLSVEPRAHGVFAQGWASESQEANNSHLNGKA